MKMLEDTDYTAWQNVDSVMDADEMLFAAKQRFCKEQRRYNDSVHFYHKKLREFAMEDYKNDDSFTDDITRVLEEYKVPICEVKKFNDPEVFEYLISNIDKFYNLSSEKKEILKNLKPDTISKLSAVLAVSNNNYLLGQIVENNKNPDYISPAIKPVIEDSYGMIVYEDQVDEILNLVLGVGDKETDMFYESLTHMAELKDIDKVDCSILLMDYLRQNECEMYCPQYKMQYYAFISLAIEKGIEEDKAKKLFNLLLAFFIGQRYRYKNTEIYNAKQLYAKAFVELKCPNRLLDSIKEKAKKIKIKNLKREL